MIEEPVACCWCWPPRRKSSEASLQPPIGVPVQYRFRTLCNGTMLPGLSRHLRPIFSRLFGGTVLVTTVHARDPHLVIVYNTQLKFKIYASRIIKMKAQL